MPNSEWLFDAPNSAASKKSGTPLFPYLVRLMRAENLTFKEAVAFFEALIAREAIPEQVAGSLVALTSKGETFEELAGMARTMNKESLNISTTQSNFIDNSGTGSSETKTFNVSTAAALVTAGAGLPVAKQTGRALVSNSGSAEVLNELGVKIAGEPKLAEACLNGAGICFMFAPKFHPALLRLEDVARNLGVRTCLSLVRVLSNPSDAPRQLIGVWHPSLVEPMAQALALLGNRTAWVVHGEDGLDEVTISGRTQVAEVIGNKIRKFEVSPEDFGLRPAKLDELSVDGPDSSAKIIREVLESQRRDEARALVIINSAAALLVGGIADDPIHAARLAEQSIDSGSARTKLDRLIQTTNKK